MIKGMYLVHVAQGIKVYFKRIDFFSGIFTTLQFKYYLQQALRNAFISPSFLLKLYDLFVLTLVTPTVRRRYTQFFI